MPSLNFMRSGKHRTRVFGTKKSRPEIRPFIEPESFFRSKVSYEVLDIHEKIGGLDLGRSQGSTSSEAVDLPLRDQPTPSAGPRSELSVGTPRELPRVEIDIPEETGSWFPAHLLQSDNTPTPSGPTRAPVTLYDEHPTPHIPPSAWKKHTPSPIKIPITEVYTSQPQGSRSSIPVPDYSRPASTTSLDAISTVSGTTLARALMGSTFIFPSESRSSKYRSGMTTLTRQDSATLPSTDDGFTYSPYWRDRRVSGASVGRTPDPLSGIPPVPVIPPALRSSVSRPDLSSRKTHEPPAGGNNEAAPSYPRVPERPFVPETPSSAGSYRLNVGVHNLSNGEDGEFSSAAPSSSRASSDPHLSRAGMDDDYYQFISAAGLEQNTRPLFTPIPEAPSSAELSQTPSLFTNASHDMTAGSSSAFSGRSKAPNQRAAGMSRKRLPIGSPSKPYSRRSSDGTPSQPSFHRGRSGSAPSPIITIRDPQDLTRYDIMVSPIAEYTESHLAQRDHADNSANATYQTFPETPEEFSPFWSPLRNDSTPIPQSALFRKASLARTLSTRSQRRRAERGVHEAAYPPVPKDLASSSTAGPQSHGNAPSSSHINTGTLHTQLLAPQPSPSFSWRTSSVRSESPSRSNLSTPLATPDYRSVKSKQPSVNLRPEDGSFIDVGDNPSPPITISAPPPYSNNTDPPTYESHRAQLAANTPRESVLNGSPSRALNRQSRMRPPLPLGPRKPGTAAPLAAARGRGDSTASTPVSSGRLSVTSSRQTTPTYTPRFDTSLPKFKGLTMDHARWTFTSNELQAIVSRSIRKSSEVSSIRLLPLQTLEHDLPEELARLEGRKDELKMRYKLLSRKRATLIATLPASLGSGDGGASGVRMTEELSRLSTQLDQIAEGLYSTTEQIGHIVALSETHSYSALAMALRKLNASFAKQVGMAQTLSLEVETLKQERDAAWAQAERYAHDYDLLFEKSHPDTSTMSSSSRRSSRVLAQRRSTARVQAALLSSGAVRSRHSSTSSNVARLSMSSLGSATRPSPMVPPVPSNRDTHPALTSLRTEYQRHESGLVSELPTTEDTAMARAQDELYEMLGITDWHVLGRRQSFSGEASDSSHRSEHMDLPPRPASLPDHTKEVDNVCGLASFFISSADKAILRATS